MNGFAHDIVLRRQAQERGEMALAQDVETYLTGVSAPVLSEQALTTWIEQARRLARGIDWLAWGGSGMPLTGRALAAHAESAAQILRTAGWKPGPASGRSLRDALIYAEHIDTDGLLSIETRLTVAEIIALLVRAATGAPYAYYESWDAHPGRTVDQVLNVLVAAAAFARRYGPA
ncbi:DUF6197 family protein [Streptomyces lavenduligriseus]|uniref:Uncharacterized protein n=1 Tax=Streptomyces lavenduligriseus TaxID=67315 RepID=A0ABT0P340_9ACTN|nr:hypothetical protein [Streptomyces lavenduligriseus]MCL3998178.1 hypothetical protein [Streptomyces lavenduligriseus]